MDTQAVGGDSIDRAKLATVIADGMKTIFEVILSICLARVVAR